MQFKPLVGTLLGLACIATSAAAQRTHAALTAADLRTRLFALAHDSMMGRAPGDIGDFKATAYIAAEFSRLGLTPAGDNGGWFQVVPFFRRAPEQRDTLRVDGYVARIGVDYAPIPASSQPRLVDGAQIIYAGLASDPATWIDSTAARGKALLFSVLPPERRTTATRRTNLAAVRDAPQFQSAAAIFAAELDASGASTAAALLTGSLVLDTTWRDMPTLAIVTNAFAGKLLGRSVYDAQPGTIGKTLRGAMRIGIFPLVFAARNVAAIFPGTDPSAKGQFISLTAHNDHVGFDHMPVDHDSLRAFNAVVRPMGADSPGREPTAGEAQRIRQILDSLRKIRPVRPDSIRNGADDDGTGTVALLEIAELLKSQKPLRRSILFVSHTAEEFGLLGSKWFTNHPTVNRDSIIGEIDMDMIGRGSVHDLPDAGPAYLETVGQRRLSTEFGNILDAVNKRQRQPFKFDVTFDAPGHPLQYYCRADHYNYARYGIPSVSLSRGEHMDYHQVTDEAQYIDYNALARVATFVKDFAVALASRPARPRLDKPKTDPAAPCVQ